MRNDITRTFVAALALGMACAVPLASAFARGGEGGGHGGGGPRIVGGGGGYHGGGYHGGGYHGGGYHGGGYGGGGYGGGGFGVGPAIGLGIAGLAAGALVGSYDPYYGNCSGYPARYDQYGRLINPC